jgi:hypothetical protein
MVMLRSRTWRAGLAVALLGATAGCELLAKLGDPRLGNPGTGGTGGGATTCSDGKRDGNETGKDCGGACSACPDGEGCLTGADCQSKVCSSGTCLVPACSDKVENGGETDVDCGGDCPPCANSQRCAQNHDCESGICKPIGCADYFIWAHGYGDTNDQHGAAVAADVAGDAQLLANVNGSIDFGGGSLSTLMPYPTTAIAALAPSGDETSDNIFTGTASSLGQGVAFTKLGNLAIAGNTAGSIDLGGGALPAGGPYNSFVGKYDGLGKHLWSKEFASSYAYAVAPAPLDGLVVVGQTDPMVNYGCAPLGRRGALVLALDATGACLWTNASTTLAYNQLATSVGVDDAGEVVVTGTANGDLDFGGTKLTAMGLDTFVAKLDASGKQMWMKVFGDANAANTSVVVATPAGDVILAGRFTGKIDFGNGPATSQGMGDVFLVRFSAEGNEIWRRIFGDPGDQGASALAIDESGNILLGGSLSGALDFGGGPLDGASRIFLAKFDSAGNHLWSRGFVGSGTAAIEGIASAGKGQVVVLGDFTKQLDFGGGPLMSAGGSDVFVAKLLTP